MVSSISNPFQSIWPFQLYNYTAHIMSSYVPKRSKSQQATQQLLDYIRTHNLKPGDILPPEQELADLFGVSLVSIRSATSSLKAFGILNASRRWGTTIAELNFEDLFKQDAFMFAFHSLPYEQLLHIRIVLECGFMEDISRNMTPEAYKELCQKAELCQQTGNLDNTSLQRQIKADYDFHSTLHKVGGNKVMLSLLQLIYAVFTYAKKTANPTPATIITRNEHRALVDALMDHRVNEATCIMRMHLLRQLDNMTTPSDSTRSDA